MNYGISKLTPLIQDSVGTAMDQLSTKVRLKKKYKTDRKDLDGRSGKAITPMTGVKKVPDIAMKTTQTLIPSLKPVYDRYKSGDIFKSAFGSKHGITSEKLWRRPTAAEEKAMGIIRKGSNPELFFAFNKDGKRYRMKKETFFSKKPEALTAMAEIIRNNPDTWPEVISANYGIILDEHFWENNPLLTTGEGLFPLRTSIDGITGLWYQEPATKPKRKTRGKGVDIHKAILKVAPSKGFLLRGHKYTRPRNPLDSQLKYDPQTGEILEIYEQPTGRTDVVSMQHDVDYSVWANKPKEEQVQCKNEADRKMVAALDAIPWKERQWGHAMARTLINTKQKLGLGLQKNERRR